YIYHHSHLPVLIRRVLSFFFHCSSALRDLHSFPTRRSSDLRLVGTRRLRAAVKGGSYSSNGDGRSELRRHCDHRQAVPAAKEMIDRKSTRLNSSHVSISYAVFCLKKKKKKMI